MTIFDSFQELLRQVQPSASDVAAAESHLSSIRAASLRRLFEPKMFTVGRYSRGTFIHGKSDVDLFVVLSRDQMRWGGDYVTSHTALERLKSELDGRFWQTEIRRNVHALVLDFFDCSVDVVSAYFDGTHPGTNWPVFNIPNGNGGWKPTSPAQHKRYIRNADALNGGKLRARRSS